ncbi:hydrogenase maturation nickel metallochaperone HypA [Robiginitalea sp.]|uniref:hydrogenase maturation nickel metallochaperone HypA n=1 Tax=Robiginitalea sp. TaxID=1902411 RepID=UPI003C7597DC
MHELSIAMGIVKIAESETHKAGASKVECIELEIGTLAGIEFESLDFVWPLAVKDTVLEQAEKRIEVIQGQARCMDCDTLFEVKKFYDSCPVCRSNLKAILKGKELRVKALEVV